MPAKRQKASRIAKNNAKQQRIAGPATSSEIPPSTTPPQDGKKYIFFFKEDVPPHGFLCNWYQPASFHDPTSELTFNCTEQFMMYHKALLFADAPTARAIIKSPGPKKQKSLGSQVEGFEQNEWDKIKQFVVREGCYLKFTQNEELRDLLLGTGDKVLVEASPFDRTWGIGYRGDVALGFVGSWGQNLLGKALVRVRDRIRREDEGEEVGEEEWKAD